MTKVKFLTGMPTITKHGRGKFLVEFPTTEDDPKVGQIGRVLAEAGTAVILEHAVWMFSGLSKASPNSETVKDAIKDVETAYNDAVVSLRPIVIELPATFSFPGLREARDSLLAVFSADGPEDTRNAEDTLENVLLPFLETILEHEEENPS